MEIWASRVSIQCLRGTFGSSVFTISLRLFGAFPIFDSPVFGKRLVVERNGCKFGSPGSVFSVYKVLLTVKFNSQTTIKSLYRF